MATATDHRVNELKYFIVVRWRQRKEDWDWLQERLGFCDGRGDVVFLLDNSPLLKKYRYRVKQPLAGPQGQLP